MGSEQAKEKYKFNADDWKVSKLKNGQKVANRINDGRSAMLF